MIAIGIDPGRSGGLAWLTGVGHHAVALDMTEADTWDALKAIPSDSRMLAVIEKVHAMPKQGVSSTFTFGQNYGMLRGMLIARRVPFEEVTPLRWQRAMGCLSRGDKNVTKAKAQQLFPDMKVTHAIADALLIAVYARRLLVERGA